MPSNFHRAIDKFLAESKRWVGNDPIKGLIRAFDLQKIGDVTKAVIEDIERRDLAKIVSKGDGHVPPTTGGFEARH